MGFNVFLIHIKMFGHALAEVVEPRFGHLKKWDSSLNIS